MFQTDVMVFSECSAPIADVEAMLAGLARNVAAQVQYNCTVQCKFTEMVFTVQYCCTGVQHLLTQYIILVNSKVF